MNIDTKEYNTSILKKVELGLTEAMEKLTPFVKIANEDKIPEELLQELALKEKINALKLIKSELIRENEKKHSNVEYKNTEDQEVSVMLKLIENHKLLIDAYNKSGNNELFLKESGELKVIEEYTPKQPTEEDIVTFTKEIINEYLATKPSDYSISARDMGQIMPKVKAKFPNVNGNIVKKTLLG